MATGPANEKKNTVVTKIGDEYQQLLHRAVDCSSIRLRRNEDGRIVSTSLWSQRDALLGKVRKFVKQSVIELPTGGGANVVAQFPPIETSYVAEYVQQDVTKPRTVRFFENHLEIWNESFLEKVVKTQEIHGDVFSDDIFGCHAFIGDELLYSAAPAKNKPSSNASSGAAVIDSGTLDEYQKIEDLGEKFPKKASPRLHVLNLTDGRLRRLGGNTPDKDVKDVQYNAAAQLLCFVFAEPFGEESPMGMYYSFNRPSILYVLPRQDFADGNLKADPIPVTSTNGCDYNVLCARFCPNGRGLVFVSSPPTLAHNMSMRLRSIELGSGITSVRASTILDIPRNPSEDEYPGLYLYFRKALIDRPFLDESGRYLILDTGWGSFTYALIVDVRTACDGCNKVTKIEFPNAGSTSVRAALGNTVVLSTSCFRSPTRLYFAVFNDFADASNFRGCFLTEEHEEAPLTWQVHRFESGNEAIYVQPTTCSSDKRASLLCFPHGGPHSASFVAYNVLVELLARQNIAVVFVNFRGSTGRGQDYMDALPGNCGVVDVEDCVEAVKWCIKEFNVDGDRVGVIGGSYGGFLSAHLTAQRPDLFKVAVMRNPVVNVASMAGGTEIPEWSYYESASSKEFAPGSYPPPPTAEDLAKMLAISPIALVENVKAPTMLQVGEKDLRVPPQQSMEWMRALRRNGTTVRVLSYPESNHSIDNAPAFDDATVQLVNFVLTSIGESKK
ncbi:hypothetical protein NDN08_002750 [Rhodosorus marinus]|uniref:Prolyl endopeptidase n=1 Tax=Rhodosorus marinus TaxID=101924 RepID=A0AAV8UY42_9RHOD|nr:hypothetical protein NDN08_002750 [Rhodosorus marinus]